jgi:hypothetical protein
VATLSFDLLDAFVGKPITDICPLGFGSAGDAHNHCAHFVGHVLKLNGQAVSGLTCAGMTSSGRAHRDAGATLRVNEIYNVCRKLDAPQPLGCLIYWTVPANISAEGVMGTMPRKHVGICFGDYAYNYGNTNDAVRKDRLGDRDTLYGSTTIVRYTAFPTAYAPMTLAEIRALVPPAPARR